MNRVLSLTGEKWLSITKPTASPSSELSGAGEPGTGTPKLLCLMSRLQSAQPFSPLPGLAINPISHAEGALKASVDLGNQGEGGCYLILGSTLVTIPPFLLHAVQPLDHQTLMRP